MGFSKLHAWQITCDHCRRLGPLMMATYQPGLPGGWDYETVHDCGMTGYTTHKVLCDTCAREAKERASARG